MAVKKTKRPALRYLVSADAKLRKLSMKKLTEGRQQTTRTKRPSRTKAPAEPPVEALRWPWTASARTLSLAVVGVVVAATLITATQMSDPAGRPGPLLSEARFVGTPAAAAAAPVRVEKPAPALTPAPVKRSSEPARPSPAKPVAATPVATAGPVIAAPDAESVTVTGCLVKNKDSFVLKDAAGAALPKTRTWRSGFFKKGLPRLNVVSASAAVKLASYDDERVSMTGTLVDRDFRARSVRRIAATCN